MKAGTFEDTCGWDKAYELVSEIHRITKDFPESEKDGIAQQMIEAAMSIPVAERYEREQGAEYGDYLAIAYNSLLYLETQYRLAVDLGYINKNEVVENLLKEVGNMLCRMSVPAMLSALQ